MREFKTKGGTSFPIKDLKGKDYLEVKYRIVWMREEHADWGVETELQVAADGKSSIAKAWIKDASGRILAMGHKTESVGGFADHAEKAETGAIGRALALCGYGTQFTDDLDEGERLADSPVEPPHRPSAPSKAVAPIRPAPANPGMVLVPSGKYKDKPIFQMSVSQLEADAAYWETRAASEQKPLTGKIGEYVAAIHAYIQETRTKTAPPPSLQDWAGATEGDVPF